MMSTTADGTKIYYETHGGQECVPAVLIPGSRGRLSCTGRPDMKIREYPGEQIPAHGTPDYKGFGGEVNRLTQLHKLTNVRAYRKVP